MRLHFEHMTKVESALVILAGVAFFIISGYVWAVVKFLSLFF